MIELNFDMVLRIVEITVIAIAILVMPRIFIKQIKQEVYDLIARFKKKGSIEDLVAEHLGLDPVIVKAIMEYLKPYLANNVNTDNKKEENKYTMWQ
jgi:hypothetical protein